MTYPTIITYRRHAGGWFYLRGGPRVKLGSDADGWTYFDPDEIRRAALDFPFLDPARAFGEWTHHVLQNPCGGLAHCSPMGHIYYGALVSGRESDEWMWQTVGHELGHAFWFRHMPDDFQAHYAALVKPLPIPGWTADECFAEDFRFAVGGPLLRIIPHQLRKRERGWRGWEDVVALVREAITRARLWLEETGLNPAEPAGEDAQDEEEPPMTESLGLKLLRPVPEKFPVSARFGDKGTAWPVQHNGVDFACPEGTPVRAVSNGVVIREGYEYRSGNVVVIGHPHWPDGGESRYCHLSRIDVTIGSSVRQGGIIGLSGSTGNRTDEKPMQPHLHLGCIARGEWFDPTPYFTTGPFPDVYPEDWAVDAIARVRDAGLMVGDERGFRPDMPVSRRELAAVVDRLVQRGKG